MSLLDFLRAFSNIDVQVKPESIATASTPELVDAACLLYRRNKEREKALELVKERLRVLAKERRTAGESPVELRGSVGVATVAFVAPTPKFVEGMDPKSLLTRMDTTGKIFLYPLFVDEQIQRTPNKDFETHLTMLAPPDRAFVSSVIAMTESTPRVSLK